MCNPRVFVFVFLPKPKPKLVAPSIALANDFHHAPYHHPFFKTQTVEHA